MPLNLDSGYSCIKRGSEVQQGTILDLILFHLSWGNQSSLELTLCIIPLLGDIFLPVLTPSAEIKVGYSIVLMLGIKY